MIVIGFEGSANKLGIGIMKDNQILCNERITYVTPPGTGFVPSETGKHHRHKVLNLLKKSLEVANIKISDVEVVCYTKGPGMACPLTFVATVARTIAFFLDKPLVPVNHCVAHIEMGRFITGSENPTLMYVSGGNTQIIAFKDGRYRIFGETMDIAIGNCLDRVGRLLNLDNSPCTAYHVEKYALMGKKYIKIPYVVKGMDVSFSGILSHCKTIKINEKQDEYDLCYSLQETVFAMIVEVMEKVMVYTKSNEALIVGGVGCNERLQQMVGDMVKQRNGKFYFTDERFCIDNGLMIAYTGMLMHKNGYVLDYGCSGCTQRFRTDSVEITWRK